MMRKGCEERATMRNFIVCNVHLVVKMIKSIRLRWAGHVAEWKKVGVLSKF